MILNIALFAAATVVLIIAVLLVIHHEYEDGLVGRFALTVIALAAYARSAGILQSEFDADISPPGILIWFGLAIFLGRHYYRFMRHYHDGSFEWHSLRTHGMERRK